MLRRRYEPFQSTGLTSYRSTLNIIYQWCHKLLPGLLLLRYFLLKIIIPISSKGQSKKISIFKISCHSIFATPQLMLIHSQDRNGSRKFTPRAPLNLPMLKSMRSKSIQFDFINCQYGKSLSNAALGMTLLVVRQFCFGEHLM
jgi:hypothetical protein